MPFDSFPNISCTKKTRLKRSRQRRNFLFLPLSCSFSKRIHEINFSRVHKLKIQRVATPLMSYSWGLNIFSKKYSPRPKVLAFNLGQRKVSHSTRFHQRRVFARHLEQRRFLEGRIMSGLYSSATFAMNVGEVSIKWPEFGFYDGLFFYQTTKCFYHSHADGMSKYSGQK